MILRADYLKIPFGELDESVLLLDPDVERFYESW